ncbi:protein kinase domain-containing protein [Micrococcoides hystricis]|uniref:non-specific serine/threonine protein kinase n=1 Tax=Micrococcoides hystricis TaxID=1572761 RepID=A0ABV6P6Q5_9MICC
MSTNLVGQTFGERYELIERIAEGGMAQVYRAKDLRLSHDVAVKVLHDRLRDEPGIADRFRQEALTAAQLNHPHIVKVTDQGLDGPSGLPYLVMEFIEGNTLRTVLNIRRKLSPKAALIFAASIVNGLAASHQAGLVHRDMKPENVLVSRDGSIKVTDFGLSRPATQHTSADVLVGTVAYVSPELVTGEQADERSDIYAVGIMLFEMLTGRQPFTGESIQVAYKHAHERVPDPREFDPELSPSLAQLVLDCTEPDPERRPANAQVLASRISKLRMQMKAAESGQSAHTEVINQPAAQQLSEDARASEEIVDLPWPQSSPGQATQVFHTPEEGDGEQTRAFTTALSPAARPEVGATVTFPEPPMPSHAPQSSVAPTAGAAAASKPVTTLAQRRQARRPQIRLRQPRPVATTLRWLLWLGGIGALGFAGFRAAEILLGGPFPY